MFTIEIKHISTNKLWLVTTIYYTKRIFRSFHSWQTFTFSSWAGVLHLNEVFNVCCFACFEEDSSNQICLMCETAERCLSRTDFRWWSTTTSQVEQNRRLLSAWNFPGYSLACSCGVMLHGFFFGFTFNTKRKEGKEVVLLPNKSKIGTFFFSKLWLVIFLPIMAHVL